MSLGMEPEVKQVLMSRIRFPQLDSEDTSTEVKRLVAPILHFSITMKVLSGFVEKAEKRVKTEKTGQLLRDLVENVQCSLLRF